MPALGKSNAFRRGLLAESFPKEWDVWLMANMMRYRLLYVAERMRLQNDARVIIAEKNSEGCDGLKVTEMLKLTVAAQAALLLLGLDHDYFARVLSIVIFPSEFELPAEATEERGRSVLGQATDYGTVFLSWETVLPEARDPKSGHNLVIHEFAHQLDFLEGYTNGAPALSNREQTQRWQPVMQGTFQRLRLALQRGEKTFLGDYAATNPTEFFSVASEKFFCVPGALRESHPELFEVLAEYYRVDPLRWFEGKMAAALVGTITSLKDGAVVSVKTAPQESEDSGFIEFACPSCSSLISFPTAESGKLRECPNWLECMFVPKTPAERPKRIPFPIRTDRLTLQRFQTVDAEDLVNLLSDEANLRYVEWNPMSRQEADEWIAYQRRIRFPKSNESCGCYFSLKTAEGKIIGVAGFWFYPDDFNLVQFEIIIHPDWHRQGYGLETLRGLLAFAFDGLRARRVVASCDARNRAAKELLLKAGFRPESKCIDDRFVKGHWVSTLGCAMLRLEYEKADLQIVGDEVRSV